MSHGKIQKQKRTRLLNKQKLQIINLIRNGVDKESVARQFDISSRTIRKILFNKENIEEAVAQHGLANKKSTKKSDLPLIEQAMSEWFYQALECGDVINGAILCQKALEFWNLFIKNGTSSNLGLQKFSASNGWLCGFKKRLGITKLVTNDVTLSSDTKSVEKFCADLTKKMELDGIVLGNLYNVDESGINYQSLTKTTLASHLKSSAGESKEKEDRFTALFCSNANGTHKLQLFCISDATESRDIVNKKLPVLNKEQKGGWMNRDCFLEWYQFHFIPEVKKHQKNTGNNGKVLLLMDNAPSHPEKNVLNAIDPNFEVMFLPPNTTAIIQPCNQGLISTTKKTYRRKLLEDLHKEKGNDQKIIENLNEITLYQSFVLLSAAWDEMEFSTLRKIWKPLLGTIIDEMEDFKHSDSTSDDSTNEKADLRLIESIVQNFAPKKKYVTEVIQEILDWLNNDDGDSGWHQQSCEEIVEVLIQGNQHNFPCLDYETMSDESKDPLEFSNDDLNQQSEELMTPVSNSQSEEISVAEAMNSMELIEKWFRQQNDLPAVDIVQTWKNNIKNKQNIVLLM